MIQFCEINKTGEEHVMINNCLLELVKLSFPQEKIDVWIDPKHYNKFPKKISGLNIIEKNVLQPSKSNKIKWISKLASEAYFLLNIFLSAKKNKSRLAFFSSLSPFGIFCATIIRTLLLSKTKVIITLHSDVEVLKDDYRKKAIESLYAKFLRFSFNRNRKWLKFLILNQVVSDNLIKDKALKQDQVIVIEHPYIFPAISEKSETSINRPIVFGHLGVAKLAKQSQLFFSLAKTLKKEIEDGAIQFVIAGQVLDEMLPYVNDYVIFNKKKSFISRDEYEKTLSDIDYAVFLYDEKSYEYTSSGAVLDALAFELPILSLKIKMFNKLFEQNNLIGIVYNDFDDLLGNIKTVISQHKENHQTMKRGVKEVKKQYTPEAQLGSFKEGLSKFL